MLATGYHGTTTEAAISIYRGEFILSEKDHLWLGKGIYFFQDAPGLAWWWADCVVKNKKKELNQDLEPAIVGAEIDIQDCMDLVDTRFHEAILKL
jgi:hypothetical protein